MAVAVGVNVAVAVGVDVAVGVGVSVAVAVAVAVGVNVAEGVNVAVAVAVAVGVAVGSVARGLPQRRAHLVGHLLARRAPARRVELRHDDAAVEPRRIAAPAGGRPRDRDADGIQ